MGGDAPIHREETEGCCLGPRDLEGRPDPAATHSQARHGGRVARSPLQASPPVGVHSKDPRRSASRTRAGPGSLHIHTLTPGPTDLGSVAPGVQGSACPPVSTFRETWKGQLLPRRSGRQQPHLRGPSAPGAVRQVAGDELAHLHTCQV